MKLSRPDIIELALSVAVAAWRIAVVPGFSLWRDWILILAAFWILRVLLKTPSQRTALTAAAAAWLLAIYAAAQAPHLLTVFGGPS